MAIKKHYQSVPELLQDMLLKLLWGKIESYSKKFTFLWKYGTGQKFQDMENAMNPEMMLSTLFNVSARLKTTAE